MGSGKQAGHAHSQILYTNTVPSIQYSSKLGPLWLHTSSSRGPDQVPMLLLLLLLLPLLPSLVMIMRRRRTRTEDEKEQEDQTGGARSGSSLSEMFGVGGTGQGDVVGGLSLTEVAAAVETFVCDLLHHWATWAAPWCMPPRAGLSLSRSLSLSLARSVGPIHPSIHSIVAPCGNWNGHARYLLNPAARLVDAASNRGKKQECGLGG